MRNFALPAVLALLIVFVSGTSACADMGMPGMQSARPSHRVLASEPFPDHVFVIFRPYARYVKDEKSGQEVQQDASEAEYAELTPDNPIVVAYDDRRWRVTLMIVPRPVAAPYKSALDLAKAVQAQQVNNAVRFDFPYKESVPEWSDRDVTITYRVQHTENSDRLEVVRTTPQHENPCCVVCLLCPVVVILGGFWLIRRWRQKITRTP